MLRPLFQDIGARVAAAQSAADYLRRLDEVIATFWTGRGGVPERVISANFAKLNAYHRQKVWETFSRALGVNVLPLMQDATIAPYLKARVEENVALIKTIPPRTKQGMETRLQQLLQERPFDQAMLREVVAAEYGSQGFNLRRITRDQTTKAIGQFTGLRHRQLGVERYQWETAGDERVRESHESNNGLDFTWDSPPPDTGHPGDDIMCRCVAIAIITPEHAARLKDGLRAIPA